MSADTSDEARTRVEAAYAVFADLWNRGGKSNRDKAVAGIYAGQFIQVSPSGNGVLKTRQGMVAEYDSRFPTAASMGRLVIAVEEASSYANVYHAVMAYHLQVPSEGEHRGRAQHTFLDSGDGLVIVRDQELPLEIEAVAA